MNSDIFSCNSAHRLGKRTSHPIELRWGTLAALLLPLLLTTVTYAESPPKPSSNAGLTIEALANAQRQKLAEQLASSTAPIARNTDGLAGSPTKKLQRQQAKGVGDAASRHSLVVLATYGTPGNAKAEVKWNGVTRLVGSRTELGTATVEAIGHGQVSISLVQPQKPAKYTLHPGDRLEWVP